MSKQDVLALYKNMLRQSAKFSGYNFRNYAFRRVRDGFIQHRSESDASKIRHLLREGDKMLALISRQGAISQMYAMPDLVVEKPILA